MYLPSHIEDKCPAVLPGLVRTRSLGMLIAQDASNIFAANPLPFLLDPDENGGPGILRAHVARASPVWHKARRNIEPQVVFMGDDAYISPSFYPSKQSTAGSYPSGTM